LDEIQIQGYPAVDDIHFYEFCKKSTISYSYTDIIVTIKHRREGIGAKREFY
jgi:hypothetical protein